MKTNKTTLIIELLILISMISAGALFYDKLPDQIPVHWNFEGKADNFSSKLSGLSILPIMSLVMIIVFNLFPQIISPKEKERLTTKAWEIIQIAILGFMAYIYFVSIYMTLNPQAPMSDFMFAGLGVLFIILGNSLGKVRQNYWVGIRVPWTFYNEDIWDKTNRFGGWMFVISGIILLLNGIIGINNYSIWIFGITLICIIILPIAYSAYLYKKAIKSENKK